MNAQTTCGKLVCGQFFALDFLQVEVAFVGRKMDLLCTWYDLEAAMVLLVRKTNKLVICKICESCVGRSKWLVLPPDWLGAAARAGIRSQAPSQRHFNVDASMRATTLF